MVGRDAAKRALRALWHKAVLTCARDITDASAVRSCLVLAPHPDDETIGCGATIHRKRQTGTAVKIVVATDGRGSHRSATIPTAELVRIRATEAAEACACLDVADRDLVMLGFEDGTLAEHVHELARSVRELIEEHRPEEVLVTSGLDWHPDHQALNRAARLALAGPGHRPELAEYPIWYWAEGPWLGGARRGCLRKLAAAVYAAVLSVWRLRAETVTTGGHLEAKHRALRAYRSQTENLTGEPEWATLDERFFKPFLGRREVFFRTDR